jgi:hypothetical protein
VSRFGNGDEELAALLGEIAEDEGRDDTPAADAEPVSPVPTATLARLYADQGFADRAVAIYRQVLADEPGNEEIQAALASLEAS